MTKEQVLASLRNRARGIDPGVSGFNNGLRAGIEEAAGLLETELGEDDADSLCVLARTGELQSLAGWLDMVAESDESRRDGSSEGLRRAAAEARRRAARLRQ